MRKVYSNACPPPAVRQDFGTVDLCEPDTTMSVAEIIDAYRNGQIVEGDGDSIFDGDDTLDDDDSMAVVYDDVLDAIDHSVVDEQPKDEQPKDEQPKDEQPKDEQPKED